MANRTVKLERVHNEFSEELRKIALERIKVGKDKKLQSMSRLTLAIKRCPEWLFMKKRMIESDMPDSKRGQVQLFGGLTGIVLFIAVALVMVLFLAMFSATFNILTTKLLTLPDAGLNLTGTMQTTFGNVNNSFNQFNWWSFGLIIGMAIGLMMSFYFVNKVHPAFFVMWILIVVACVIMSIGISRSYEALYTNSGFLGTQLHNYAASSWMILNLPLVISVFGLIGGVLLFISINMSVDEVGAF